MNLLAPDKIQHMMGGCLIALVTLPLGAGAAMASVIAVGVGKEIVDKVSGKGVADVWDAVATIAAGAVTLAIQII